MSTLRQLSAYRFEGKSEQAVREEWIRPLLVHLGYGIETLNEVKYEEQLALAAPFRRIGRTRIKIDYRPTVLGHGLWIIEAKAHRSEAWEEAVSQAWLYATHPEIDVPFMAIADGAQISVYDTYRVAWDEPLIAVETPKLEREFSGLAEILGADNVTRAVRQRRIRHLGSAMEAEVDPARLREYVKEVEELAAKAQPIVIENQKSIIRDQFETEERQQRELVEVHGLFALGIWANQVSGVPKKVSGMARDRLLATPPEDRMQEMRRLRDAARHRRGAYGSNDPRMFWNLRHVELFVALSARHAEGCEPLEVMARQALRDHILNFPEDQLGRAAHRLERVLPLFVARSILAKKDLDLPTIARELQAHWSDEMRLRIRMSGDHLFTQIVTDLVRKVWSEMPWNVDSLTRLAEALEQSLPAMVDDPKVEGPAGDPHFAWLYERDMLQMAALSETGDLVTPELLDDEVVVALEDIASNDPDHRRIAEPAARLVASYRAGS